MIAHTGKTRRRRILPSRETKWTFLFLVLGLGGLLVLYSRPPADYGSPHLERVLSRGELVVVTRNGPTSYYVGPHGEAGFEYDLAVEFARHLGVTLRMQRVHHLSELFAAIRLGNADIAAAGITATPEREQFVQFGPTYFEAAPIVVYRADQRRPDQLEDLLDLRIAVLASSSYEQMIQQVQARSLPDLTWETSHHADIESVLDRIESGQFQATIVDSNVYQLHRRFYPNIRAGMQLADPQPLAWAFPPGDDPSLLNAATEFFQTIKEDGRLERLERHYYGMVDEFAPVETMEFLRNIERRLPPLIPLFRDAEQSTGVDWTLLAAIGYQESHWQPDAVSPTGVRGLMMLTLRTAGQMGVSDRLDPEQSIAGGARYYLRMRERLPDRIQDPDRTWLALAAYNIGYGHLEDARILTQRAGMDPDRWDDVALHLPLLSKPEFYRTVRHGYARGREPVRYVENVRSYQDILVWSLRRNPSLVGGLGLVRAGASATSNPPPTAANAKADTEQSIPVEN